MIGSASKPTGTITVFILAIVMGACTPKTYVRNEKRELQPSRRKASVESEPSAQSGRMVISFDPLLAKERVELYPRPAPPSASVVWVEPGPRNGTITLYSQKDAIPDESLRALSLTRDTRPDLRLSFQIGFGQQGAAEAQLLLGAGARFWGATAGPVTLAGKARRNLQGAEVIEKWRDLDFLESLKRAPPLEGFSWKKRSVDLAPPCLAE